MDLYESLVISREYIPNKFNIRFIQLTRYATKSTPSASYYHYIGKEPLVYRTISQQFARAADKFGDNEAIVSYHEGKRLTYTEAQKQVFIRKF